MVNSPIISSNIQIANNELAIEVDPSNADGSSLVRDGWGVFRNTAGISVSRLDPELVEVYEDHDDAKTRAEELQESQGEIDYLDGGDPEGTIYRTTWFSIGRVVLEDTRQVTIATYQRVDGE